MENSSPAPEALLAKLDDSTAAEWHKVAKLFAQLEAHSRVSPDGRPWIALVEERLAAVSHPKSTGHLRKLRRAYGFLQAALPELSPEGVPPDLSQVSFTALETAERLSKLDHAAGRAALKRCLEGASPAALKDLYDQAQIDFADQMPASRLAWKKKRQTADAQAGARAPAPHDPSAPLSAQILEQCRTDPATWWSLPDAQVAQFSPKNLGAPVSHEQAGFLALSPAGDRIIGGFDFYSTTDWDDSNWRELLEHACFCASFFDRYWLVLEAPRLGVRRWWAQLNALGPHNIGLAHAEHAKASKLIEIGRGSAAPCPDRRALITTALLRDWMRLRNE